MVADSSRESGAIRTKVPGRPDWSAEPGLFRPEQLALAEPQQGGQVRDAQIIPPGSQPTSQPTREQMEAELQKLEAAKAKGEAFDKGAYMKFHAQLGTMDMDAGKPNQAKEHFKRADAEFKAYFEQADKVFADSKRNNQPVDAAYEKNYQVAVRNYMDMVHSYGKVVMVSLNSYADKDVPDYVDRDHPEKLAEARQDRTNLYEAYNRAVQHAGSLKFPPMLLAEIFRDKGMNAAMLADDLYRPRRLEQEVGDVPNWRIVKDASIADLTAADTILDTILGPKDQNLDTQRDRRPKPPEAPMEMRAKVLDYLAKVEMHRLDPAAPDFVKRADTAGTHFIQALNAWDRYAPKAEGSDVLRTKPIYDYLLQHYTDYAMFAGLMGANSRGLEGFSWAAKVNDAMNTVANIRRVSTNIPR